MGVAWTNSLPLPGAISPSALDLFGFWTHELRCGHLAEFAQTALNGVSLTSPFRPQTLIWFLVYTQLRRADGEAHRNLLLAKLQGAPPDPVGAFEPPQHGIPVNAASPDAAIDNILATLRLPVNAPLSVLAVELFNGESLVVQQDSAKAVIESHGKLPSETGKGTQGRTAQPAAVAASGPTGTVPQASQRAQVLPDPLGNELGMQRILRVSPLTPVWQVC
jgi:hypothetical protein